jgi:hypothetical protein
MVAVPPIVDLSLGCRGTQQWAVMSRDVCGAEFANPFKVGQRCDSYVHKGRVTLLLARGSWAARRGADRGQSQMWLIPRRLDSSALANLVFSVS